MHAVTPSFPASSRSLSRNRRLRRSPLTVSVEKPHATPTDSAHARPRPLARSRARFRLRTRAPIPPTSRAQSRTLRRSLLRTRHHPARIQPLGHPHAPSRTPPAPLPLRLFRTPARQHAATRLHSCDSARSATRPPARAQPTPAQPAPAHRRANPEPHPRDPPPARTRPAFLSCTLSRARACTRRCSVSRIRAQQRPSRLCSRAPILYALHAPAHSFPVHNCRTLFPSLVRRRKPHITIRKVTKV